MPESVVSKNKVMLSVLARPRTNCSTDEPSPGRPTSAYSFVVCSSYSGGLNITGTASGGTASRTTISALDSSIQSLPFRSGWRGAPGRDSPRACLATGPSAAGGSRGERGGPGADGGADAPQ